MNDQTIVVRSNRLWGWWALAMIAAGLLFSGWFLYISTRSERAGLGSMTATMGVLGLVAFALCARVVIRTLRAPWRLELSRTHLTFFTRAYDLSIPWDRVAGIAVTEVDQRMGCALVFDDVAEVVQGAKFHPARAPQGGVASAAQMRERMEGSFGRAGFHMGIPPRVLELRPEALAGLLTRAKTGALWREGTE